MIVAAIEQGISRKETGVLDHVSARAGVDEVVSAEGRDRVVAGASQQDVGGVAVVDRVVAGAGGDVLDIRQAVRAFAGRRTGVGATRDGGTDIGNEITRDAGIVDRVAAADERCQDRRRAVRRRRDRANERHQRVVAAIDGVVAGAAEEDVVAGVADKHVVAGVTGRNEVRRSEKGDVFDVRPRDVEAIRRHHRVDAFAGVFSEAVADTVEHVGVVADTADERVVAGAAVQDVVSGTADQRVSARAAEKDVVAGAAVERVVAGAAPGAFHVCKAVRAFAGRRVGGDRCRPGDVGAAQVCNDSGAGGGVVGDVAGGRFKRPQACLCQIDGGGIGRTRGIVDAAVEAVVAAAAGKDVVAGTAEDDVVAGTTAERVVAIAAAERVVARSADELVIAQPADDNVVAGTAVDRVVTAAADNRVVAAKGRDRHAAVGGIAPVGVADDDDVVAGCCRDRFDAGKAGAASRGRVERDAGGRGTAEQDGVRAGVADELVPGGGKARLRRVENGAVAEIDRDRAGTGVGDVSNIVEGIVAVAAVAACRCRRRRRACRCRRRRRACRCRRRPGACRCRRRR